MNIDLAVGHTNQPAHWRHQFSRRNLEQAPKPSLGQARRLDVIERRATDGARDLAVIRLPNEGKDAGKYRSSLDVAPKSRDQHQCFRLLDHV